MDETRPVKHGGGCIVAHSSAVFHLAASHG